MLQAGFYELPQASQGRILNMTLSFSCTCRFPNIQMLLVLQLGLEQEVAWDLYKQSWYRVLKTFMSYPRRVSLLKIVLDFLSRLVWNQSAQYENVCSGCLAAFFYHWSEMLPRHTTCLSRRTYVVLISLLHVFDVVYRATYAQISIV